MKICIICFCLIAEMTQLIICKEYARPSPTDMPYSQRDLINKKVKMKSYLKNLNSFKVLQPNLSANGSNGIANLLIENEKIPVPFSEKGLNEVSKIHLDKNKLNRYLEILDMEIAKTPATIELDPSKIKAYVKMLNTRQQSKPVDLISRSRIKLMKGSNKYHSENRIESQHRDDSLYPNVNEKIINSEELSEKYEGKKLAKQSEERNSMEKPFFDDSERIGSDKDTARSSVNDFDSKFPEYFNDYHLYDSNSLSKFVGGEDPEIDSINSFKNNSSRRKRQSSEEENALLENSNVNTIESLNAIGLSNVQDISNNFGNENNDKMMNKDLLLQEENPQLSPDYQPQPLSVGKKTEIMVNSMDSNQQEKETENQKQLLKDVDSKSILFPQYSGEEDRVRPLENLDSVMIEENPFQTINHLQNIPDHSAIQAMKNVNSSNLMNYNIAERKYTDNSVQSAAILNSSGNNKIVSPLEPRTIIKVTPGSITGYQLPFYSLPALDQYRLNIKTDPPNLNPGLFLFAKSNPILNPTPNYFALTTLLLNQSFGSLANAFHDSLKPDAKENELIAPQNIAMIELSSLNNLKRQSPNIPKSSSFLLAANLSSEHKIFPLKPNNEILNVPKTKYFKECFINKNKAGLGIPTKPTNMYSNFYLSRLKNIQNYKENEDFLDFMKKPISPQFGTRENEVSKIINVNLEHLHFDKGALYKIIGKALKVDDENKGGDWALPQWLSNKYNELLQASHRGQTLNEVSNNDRDEHYPVFPRCMLAQNGFKLEETEESLKEKQNQEHKIPLNKENLKDKAENENTDNW